MKAEKMNRKMNSDDFLLSILAIIVLNVSLVLSIDKIFAELSYIGRDMDFLVESIKGAEKSDRNYIETKRYYLDCSIFGSNPYYQI